MNKKTLNGFDPGVDIIDEDEALESGGIPDSELDNKTVFDGEKMVTEDEWKKQQGNA